MNKKWKLNFQFLSSLKLKNENLEACYGFLSVGTYKATPNSIEKKTMAYQVGSTLFFLVWLKETIVLLRIGVGEKVCSRN